MEYIFSLFPHLPLTNYEIIFNVVAILGAIMISYGIFIESEKKQDLIMVIGALCLFAYAVWIGNIIFMVAMGGVALASAIEFIEILLGRHVHSTDMVEKYKHPEN